jgi:hypothetical protein
VGDYRDLWIRAMEADQLGRRGADTDGAARHGPAGAASRYRPALAASRHGALIEMQYHLAAWMQRIRSSLRSTGRGTA